VVDGATTTLGQVRSLISWVSSEVKDDLEESTSALEVLHRKKGECQAHTLLYTALARAKGIPTRLVGGLVYAEGMGFLYHAWAESYVDGWIATDPTFNQVGVDASHIKLVQGESWMSLLQIGNIIGKVKANVLDFQVSCR
jgi:transglutaminase-like putative cysteine protease